MMGFSAGGHVAASLGTRFAEKLYPVQDGAENFSPRPDAMVLVYPVISMRDGIAHEGARTRLLGAWPDQKTIDAYSMETRVHPLVPPTLLIHAADDDDVSVNHSMAFLARCVSIRSRQRCISIRKAGTDLVSAAWQICPSPAGRC